MLAIILSQTVELLVKTVTLTKTDSDEVFLFRCPDDGGAVAQFKGKISKIYPHMEPSNNATVINKCRSCDACYTFQTLPGKDEQPIKVVLALPTIKDQGYFFCPNCRNNILMFNSRNLVSVGEKKEVVLPYSERCAFCQWNYTFSDIV